MPDPTKPEEPADDEDGPYRLVDEEPTPRMRSEPPRVAPAPSRVDRGVDDAEETDDDASEGGDDDAEDASLPPAISRPTNPKPWLVIAGVCTALLLISWLAGAQQLVLPDGKGVIAELGFGDRVQGVLRTVIFIPLAMLSAVFGLGSLAFLHQRPLGDAGGLFAKSLAIVSMACLVWLVPSDIRILKQALHVLGMPVIATALAVPIFRLHPRDAAIATGCSLLGMMLLVLGSWVVVWSVS